MSENRVFVSYCTGRSLPDITPEQAKKLTHLNVAFAVTEGDQLVADAVAGIVCRSVSGVGAMS